MIAPWSSYKLEVSRAGKIVHRAKGNNLVTTVGEEYAAGRFGNTVLPTAMDYIALGSGDTAPTKEDTELETEISGTRTASTTDTHIDNTIVFVFDYTHAGAPISVQEAGLFDNAAFETGNMAARFLTQVFTMAAGDALKLTWTLGFEGID